jgi:TRAP-type uncharacterized transport system substrate-binding protein
MEKLPRGANFLRAKMLWEAGLQVAGNPATPYGGDRDVCITIGNGSGKAFRPSLRMATGSPILAHDVIGGGIEMAMINPSGLLTQAYRGVGIFPEKLPVRIVAVYPSHDQFVFAIHPRTGLRSLADIKERRYPLQVSVKEDPTHSTRVLVDQVLALYGFSLADIEAWGGRLHMSGSPADPRRMGPMRDGTLEAVFDEALVVWFEQGLEAGLVPLELDAEMFAKLGALGWRRVVIPGGRYRGLPHDHACIDYSGWPLYASAALPERLVYDVCAALAAREDEIAWEDGAYTGIMQLWTESAATPMDVPLHPGAARFVRERGGS